MTVDFIETNRAMLQIKLDSVQQCAFFFHEGTLFRRITDTGSSTTAGIECLDMELLDVCYLDSGSIIDPVEVDKVIVKVTYK
jgi:hypothetical protein